MQRPGPSQRHKIRGYSVKDGRCVDAELGTYCTKPYCVCSPDVSSSFPYKCDDVAARRSSGGLPPLPDCLLVSAGPRRSAERILIECKCNLERGARTRKEPARLLGEIESKFNAASHYQASRRVVVIPPGREFSALAGGIKGKGWEVEYCCSEVCGVCKWCS